MTGNGGCVVDSWLAADGETVVEIVESSGPEVDFPKSWWWRTKAANHETLSTSETYTRKWSAQRGARRSHPPVAA